jgi:hypothetical protein
MQKHIDAISRRKRSHGQNQRTNRRLADQGIQCPPRSSRKAMLSRQLAYYMDHSILVLNANALRDFVASNAMESLTHPCKVSRQTVDVACRSLDLILSDPILLKHMYGTHNNQLIMICHALSEILFVSHGSRRINWFRKKTLTDSYRPPHADACPQKSSKQLPRRYVP